MFSPDVQTQVTCARVTAYSGDNKADHPYGDDTGGAGKKANQACLGSQCNALTGFRIYAQSP